MKKSILLVIFLAFASSLCAQQPVVEWAKTYGGSNVEYPADIILTADNKYVIAGSTNSKDFDVTQNRGGEDVWVVKLDEDGKILWQKSYGGTGNEGATAIKQTKDGGFMLLGVTNSKNGDFIATKGDLDIFFSKLDKDGKIIWTRIYGGNKYDQATSFFETESGEFVISIISQSDSLDFDLNYGNDDIWVMKTKPNGDIIWKKHIGGTRLDQVHEIIQAEKGAYLLVGTTGSIDKDMVVHKDTFFSTAQGDVWIKLDTSGSIIWHKTYEGTNMGSLFARIRAVKADSSGYIGVGVSRNFARISAPSNDLLVEKLDKNGNLKFFKLLGGFQNDFGSDIEILADGSFIVAGFAGSSLTGDITTSNLGLGDFWLMRIDKTGEKILWQILLGGSETDGCSTRGLLLAPRNELVLVGETRSMDKNFSKMNGINDLGIIKLKSVGLPTSLKNFYIPVDISVYPNPANQYIYVKNNEIQDLDYELIDIYGRILIKGRVNTGTSTISLQGVKTGTHFLQFKKNNLIVNSKQVFIHE
jgi:hypothetical protein